MIWVSTRLCPSFINGGKPLTFSKCLCYQGSVTQDTGQDIPKLEVIDVRC